MSTEMMILMICCFFMVVSCFWRRTVSDRGGQSGKMDEAFGRNSLCGSGRKNATKDNTFFKSGAKVRVIIWMSKKIPDKVIFRRGDFNFCYQRGSGIGKLRLYPQYSLNTFISAGLSVFADLISLTGRILVLSLRAIFGACTRNRPKNQVKSEYWTSLPIAILSLLRNSCLLIIG